MPLQASLSHKTSPLGKASTFEGDEFLDHSVSFRAMTGEYDVWLARGKKKRLSLSFTLKNLREKKNPKIF
jgi:hypothetical protein